jgi:hypothetical protein
MTALSAGAKLALDRLLEMEAGEVLAVPLPHGLSAAERQHELDTHQAVVAELRAAGWPIETERYGSDNGEVLTIGIVEGAPRPAHPR